MPLGLFGNKFSPKKTPPRRAQSLSNLHLDATESKAEFGLDYGALKVSLGGNQVAFENGLWIAGKLIKLNVLVLVLFKGKERKIELGSICQVVSSTLKSWIILLL